MTKKGLYKLVTRPHIFLKDYMKKVKDKKILFDFNQKESFYQGRISKPILNFGIENLIIELNTLEIQGLYIEPINPQLQWVVAILKQDKKDFIFKFLNFLYENNIALSYKYKKEMKKVSSNSEFWSDISSLKNIELCLDIRRSLSLSKLYFRLEIWEEFDTFYLSPSANHISRKLWKNVAKKERIFEEKKLINYASILNYSHELEVTFDIDLVFTWVNSDDEDWKNMYSQYKPLNDESDATSTSRFLSRDELKYALRSWDKYGNFIRNIYIISNCKPPSWLDLNQSNLKWIYHEEILPKEVLPTFSSHAIETSLHKIEGLSNYFIYSNDDFLLVKPSYSNDFYYSNGIAKLRLEPYGNVNGDSVEGDADYLNAARNSTKLLEQDFQKTSTQLHTHSPQSMRIDLLKEMEVKYSTVFNETMSHKFRTYKDIAVTGYLYHHYALLTGNALPDNVKTELVQQNHNFKKKLSDILVQNDKGESKNLPLSVCLNDGADSHMNEEWNEAITSFLENYFPEPSKYEKE